MHKRIAPAGTALAFLIVALAAPAAQADTFCVNRPGCADPGHNFTTISAAIVAADANDPAFPARRSAIRSSSGTASSTRRSTTGSTTRSTSWEPVPHGERRDADRARPRLERQDCDDGVLVWQRCREHDLRRHGHGADGQRQHRSLHERRRRQHHRPCGGRPDQWPWGRAQRQRPDDAEPAGHRPARNGDRRVGAPRIRRALIHQGQRPASRATDS